MTSFNLSEPFRCKPRKIMGYFNKVRSKGRDGQIGSKVGFKIFSK